MPDGRPHSSPGPLLLWPLVALGVLSISSASILIRLAEAPPLSIATYRVGLATLLLAPYFVLSGRPQKNHWHGQTLKKLFLSGFFLAFHFLFWIHSLKLTSIASSVTLVSTTPLFVAALSYFKLGEKPNAGAMSGIFLTLAGSVLIAGMDFSLSGQALLGDMLAILGALAATGYLVTGRMVRQSLSLTAYIFCVYGSASLILLLCCYLTGTSMRGFSAETYVILLLLAAVPQLIGHTTFNWALKFLSATLVAVLILGEPIGAISLAFLFLGEKIGGLQAIGLVILGAGILICSWSINAGEQARPFEHSNGPDA